MTSIAYTNARVKLALIMLVQVAAVTDFAEGHFEQKCQLYAD